jgi:Flp pilus assembly pilin Flp
MRTNVAHFRKFLRNSRGAVTVDYVVLAAAVTAVGLYSTDIIGVGMRSLAGTVDEELSGTSTDTVVGLQYASGFDNGSEGWSGATAQEMNGIGNVLGPIENTSGLPGVSRDFAIDPNATEASFAFDLYAMDDFDGDTGTVFIDGQAVGSVTVDQGVPTFTAASDLAERGIIIRYTEIDKAVNLGGNPDRVDAMSNISITVKNLQENPRENINFGFGSDASAGANNEYFAIDNFTATGLADN